MEDALRRQLAAAVGTSGMDAEDVVRPANVTQLRQVLADCVAASAAVAVVGSAQAASAPVVIAADNLDSILLNPTALLLHAGAAATWVAVREAASARRMEVSALPSVRSQTVGESVALGEIAHRSIAGGRTLKDVVGYDFAGLALGSGSRLGVIVAVTLRLDPAGTRTPAQPGLGPWRGDDVIDVDPAFAQAG